MNEDRYRDRPLLRLLDCYVLDVIGELPPQQQATLKKLEPTLRKTFAAAGSWQEIVAEQMGMLPSVTLGIETLWAGFQADEERLGRQARPADFVREFVAQNFPGMLEDEDRGE